MAKSCTIQPTTTAVAGNTYPHLSIHNAAAITARPKVFEFVVSSYVSPPNDYASQYKLTRSSAALTGGNTPTIGYLDMADGVALATAMSNATGGTMTTVVMTFSVNLRATFRWVAAPGKEFVVPITSGAGIGLVVAAQSTAYGVDVTLMWEE